MSIDSFFQKDAAAGLRYPEQMMGPLERANRPISATWPAPGLSARRRCPGGPKTVPRQEFLAAAETGPGHTSELGHWTVA